MRILIINKYYFVDGGPERYMFSLIELLEKYGHEVVPLTLDLKKNRYSPYAEDFLPSPFGKEFGHYADSSLSLGAKITLAARSIYYPLARKRVKQIIDRENIDVVYLLNIYNYISLSVIDAATQSGTRVIMRLSDFNFICASCRFFRDGRVCMACQHGLHNALKYRCVRDSLSMTLARVTAIKLHMIMGIYNRVDKFVAPSTFTINALAEMGIPHERLHYLPSFVNLEQYEPCFKPGNYVLYFGRLDRDKGVDVLVRAFQVLGSDAPYLRIIGKGKQEVELRSLADRLQNQRIKFYGYMNKAQLIKQIQGAAFVVVPSLWPDNSPMAVYESMACGKPVIGSMLGGLLDQIEDGENGYLVEPGNEYDLAQAVKSLWEDKVSIESLGREARLRMETEFGPESHMSKLCNIFLD
jgi:glycosyltransferase involved in cell wall biosynthesis